MSELLIPTLLSVAGLGLLVIGGELLVRGASALALMLRISPLVVGLTVVAFGTSAPELAVSVQSAWLGSVDVAVGNVLGSNILNVLVVLGSSAVIMPLSVSSQLVRREVPLMVTASLLLFFLGRDGRITATDGLILVTILLWYIVRSVRASRRETEAIQSSLIQAIPSSRARSRRAWQSGLQLIAGLTLLVAGSRCLVTGAVTVAKFLEVSELLIGLTVVAVGTSLPEIVTTVIAAARGERDIAVGNVVGSNLFNILCVVGFSSIVAPDGLTVSTTALMFDFPVMIAVAIVCLPVFLTGHEIARWEGCVFLACYLGYTSWLTVDAMDNGHEGIVSGVMWYLVIPLSGGLLLIDGVRHLRRTSLRATDNASVERD
ncbi:MAG: calcium/sodium antiporter [Planctomycetota bacterium]|jgi:cation:H+ antiporter